MQAVFDATMDRWDWRVSARWRLFSLGSVWMLVFFASLAGPLLPLVGLLRFLFGGSQLVLNQLLARRVPLAPRDRLDWTLLVLCFLGSIAAAALAQATGVVHPAFALPLLVPYTVLQWRSYRLSLRTHRGAAPEPIPFPVRADSRSAAA